MYRCKRNWLVFSKTDGSKPYRPTIDLNGGRYNYFHNPSKISAKLYTRTISITALISIPVCNSEYIIDLFSDPIFYMKLRFILS